jgi:hypothetical protein
MKKLKTIAGIALLSLPFGGIAYDINEKLSADLSIAAVYQWSKFFKDLSGDTGKGSVATDIGINFHPTEIDEFQITVSFAGGNGLKETFGDKGFSLAPNADDLEDDLKDINGRDRDYLLEAWYKHTFKVKNWEIGITGGIIDATAYIDENEYANDELEQFMNDAFVNNPLANLPSYDLGGVVEISNGAFSVKGLVMNSKNDDDRNYDYYSAELGYSGNINNIPWNGRIYYYRTTEDFPDRDGNYDYLEGVGFSGDLTWNYIGIFLRLGLNTHTDTGDFKSLTSGGFVLNGKLWHRKEDKFGIGLAYFDGNEEVSGIKDSTVAEAYYALKITRFAALTFDIQYNEEKHTDEKLGATTYGVRLVASF